MDRIDLISIPGALLSFALLSLLAFPLTGQESEVLEGETVNLEDGETFTDLINRSMEGRVGANDCSGGG